MLQCSWKKRLNGKHDSDILGTLRQSHCAARENGLARYALINPRRAGALIRVRGLWRCALFCAPSEQDRRLVTEPVNDTKLASLSVIKK